MAFGECPHCGEEMGNRCVVMSDNSLLCYTCGRLRADINIGDIHMFALKADALDKRELKKFRKHYEAYSE